VIQVLLLAIILTLALYGLSALLKSSRTAGRTAPRKWLLWLLLAVFIALGLTGRLGWVVPLVGAALAALIRLAPTLIRLIPFLARRPDPFAAGGGQQQESAGKAKMSRDEALEILGLGPDASREHIVEAHRRLIQKLHPDRGGSTYLSAKLNQARDTLLG
jgi:DnaJ homolog subfamily C member 19